MSKKPFTFRKEKRNTGLFSVGHPHPDTVVKHDRMKVGTIAAPSWTTQDGSWAVRFMVEGNDHNPNCDWHWVGIKSRFNSEPEARAWIQENAERVLNLNLHHEEDVKD